MSTMIRSCAWCAWTGTTKDEAIAHRATHADRIAANDAGRLAAERAERERQGEIRDVERERRARIERDRVQADLLAARVRASAAATRRADAKRRRENPMTDADYDDVVRTYQLHGRADHNAGMALADRIDRSEASTFMMLAQVAGLDPSNDHTGLETQAAIRLAWDRRTR